MSLFEPMHGPFSASVYNHRGEFLGMFPLPHHLERADDEEDPSDVRKREIEDRLAGEEDA